MQRNREELKAIRRGEWTLDQVEETYNNRKRQVETAYEKSKLPEKPDVDKIKKLLFDCLEQFYDNVSRAERADDGLLDELKALVRKYD